MKNGKSHWFWKPRSNLVFWMKTLELRLWRPEDTSIWSGHRHTVSWRELRLTADWTVTKKQVTIWPFLLSDCVSQSCIYSKNVQSCMLQHICYIDRFLVLCDMVNCELALYLWHCTECWVTSPINSFIIHFTRYHLESQWHLPCKP